MALYGLLMLLGVAMGAIDRVYYTFHDGNDCDQCTQETVYVIDECFETEDDDGSLQYAKATWITEGQRVQLAFHGRDELCSVDSITEAWPYDLDQCVVQANFGAESVSAEPWTCPDIETVWYIWDEFGVRCDACYEQTQYNIGQCTRATIFGEDVYAQISLGDVDRTVIFTQHGQDSTCTSQTANPVIYTLDECVAVDNSFSERVSTTAFAGVCTTDLRGMSWAGVILWIILPITILIGCFCCMRRRRRYRGAPGDYNAVPTQALPQQPVYVQAQPQPAVYAQQAYAGPIAYAQPQQAYVAPQQAYAQPPTYVQPQGAPGKAMPYVQPAPPQY